jgi:UDP-N-acetylmuramoyl-L-alanyl-D-glutamate--2,6-diaminopimelate ligase
MKVIGITGTNGKTTITHIVCEILTNAGFTVGKIGTLTGRLTTPSPWELSELFEQFRTQKTDYVIMEVSSHGIHQDRIKGIFYHVKLLTNITQDHLDYHKTLSEYKKVKLGWMARGHGIKLYPRDWQKVKLDFEHPYVGHFNDNNIKCAYAILQALHCLPEQKLKDSFKNLSQVPGRYQPIMCNQPFKVIVDYAHTPDGLQNVIATSLKLLKKEHKGGRLITVFGCGGDRDKGKRPIMGCLAFNHSTITIITSDNPRTENPDEIIKEVLVGIKPRFLQKKKEVIVEPDRHLAIQRAIELARPNDLVLLAGKGHETYQIVKGERIHFDDREEATAALNTRGYR